MSVKSIQSICLSVIFIFAAIAYFPSLDAPFYLDDYDSIASNPVIREVNFAELNRWYSMRQLGYLTFALDYSTHETDPAGYRLTNFFIHLLVILSVFWFTRLCCVSLRLTERHQLYMPLFAAAIFALAPLNSQAVIYIVQRLAMLTALFYILGLCAWMKFRLIDSPHKWIWLATAVLMLICGLFVKQNIATFPLAVLLLEIVIFQSISSKVLQRTAVIGLALLLSFHLVDFLNGAKYLNLIDSLSKESEYYSRWEYLSHQFYAVWMYIYKFLVPFPLRLEYGWENFGWQDNRVWVGFTLTWLALGASVLLRKKHPLLAVMIVLYFVLHLIESSIFPIKDLVFEHRAYLPNVALSVLVSYLMATVFVNRIAVAFVPLCCVLVFYTWTTNQRASLWTTPIEFYRHELRQEGESTRMYSSLAVQFAMKGDERNATKWFRIALQVSEKWGRLQVGTIVAYIDLLNSQGKEAEAKRYGFKALKLAVRPKDKADILATIVKLDVAQGQCKDYIKMLNRALTYHPENILANHLMEECERQLSEQQ